MPTNRNSSVIDHKQSIPHLCAMAPLSTWARLLLDNRGVDLPYAGEALKILVATTLASPLRVWERVRFGGRIARTTIEKPPIFVLGAPRSGTTHLHNLLLQDEQFGAVTTYQAALPTFFLTGGEWLKQALAKRTPKTRPMDNVRVGLDVPQEEEIAIANSSHVSSLHHFTFPRRAREYFDKYAMMQGLTPHELAIWDRTFMEIVRKATYWAQGKQLVMKSPTNSGRIAHLLRLFPEAVFIHIVRNPFEVYRSFMHLYNKFMPPNQLQVMDPQDMADHLVHAYRGMMGGIIEDRSLVPDGRFLEIRFENLEQRPIAELQRTYAELKIPGWDRARPRFESYLGTLSGYRKNSFQLDHSVIDRVSEEWAFALEEWNYQLPQAVGSTASPHS